MVEPLSLDSPQIHRLQEAIEASKKMAPPHLPAQSLASLFPDTLSKSVAELPRIPAASKPRLTPPHESSCRPSFSFTDLLKLQLRAEKLKEEASVIQEEALEHHIDHHQELLLQRAKKEAELSQQLESSSSWERYRQLTSFVSTALPFFGAAVSLTGGPATAHLTYLLLATASSTLFNEAMTRTNSWQWLFGHIVSDEQTKVLLASVVEKTLSIATTVLAAVSLSSFASSFQVDTSNFWNGNNAFNFSLALKTISDLSSTFLGIQKSVSDAKAYQIQADAKIFDGEATAYRNNCELTSQALKENAKNQEQLSKICHEALLSHQAMIASTI
jgi:hypothetical protein